PMLVLAGAMGWAGAPIGLLSQGYFILLPVIAVADGIHLVMRTGELGRIDHSDRDRVIVDGCRRVGLSCFATSATTAMGFASLALSSMPMLRAFGLWAAGGVMLAWALLLFVGPLLLSCVEDLRGHPQGVTRLDEWLVRATAIARRRPLAVVIVALAIAGAASWRARDIPVDNRLSDLVDAREPAARASAVIDARLGGVLSLELELSGEPGSFAQPERMAAMDRLERWLAAQPGVRAVIGPATLLRASGAGMDDADALQRGLRRLEDAGLREGVLDGTDARARISVRVTDAGGLAFAALEERVLARARQVEGLGVVSTGTTALAYHGVNRIAGELRTSLLGAFVVVTLTIAVVFRDVRLGIAAIIPNGIPLAIGWAAIAIGLGRFDPLGGIVLAVALGIAVDDTIHLVARAREASVEAPDEDAIASAVRGTGMACTITSIVLAAGLALFLSSSFPPLRVLGGLGATVIIAALVCDLWLLPAVLRLLRWPARSARKGS
ncbi:MAG TPA: MMPL family transporter, partial [Nannocystaceae bacterium]|nr:MMPL family transporter [Nannocystaceae bacterium]